MLTMDTAKAAFPSALSASAALHQCGMLSAATTWQECSRMGGRDHLQDNESGSMILQLSVHFARTAGPDSEGSKPCCFSIIFSESARARQHQRHSALKWQRSGFSLDAQDHALNYVSGSNFEQLGQCFN